jgi:glutamyl-tRNA(Gln) amidotransferase subunit D
MKPGDIVKITHQGKMYEGTLLPSLKGTVMKLANGYNIGFTSEVSVKVVGEEKRLEKFPEIRLEDNATLPQISMIATGGTIASRIDYRTGGVHMLMEPRELLYSTPELSRIAHINNILSPFRIGSESMTFSCYKKIAELAARELNSGSEGVIVTHGTDTLHYTSAALSFMLRNLTKPVCLVGAQRSPDRGSFDGSVNLICAAHTALSDVGEVTIVMHAQSDDNYCNVLRGTKARKMHSTRRDAFKAINDVPIAFVYPSGVIEYRSAYRKRGEGETFADTVMEEKVAFIKAYPNAQTELIDFLIDRKYKGILVEASALGHVPTDTVEETLSWVTPVRRACEEGVIVAFATQCLYGRVNPFVYSNARIMHDIGVIYLGDMLPECGYIKLAWVLGHTNEYEEARKMMLTNYAGEIRGRSDFCGF